MASFIYFSILLSLVTDILSLDSLTAPVPNSDCPLIDDVNHAVMLPYPPDCSKYFSCLKGRAYLQQCPNNLLWSTLTYRCDYPEKATCATFVPTNGIQQVSNNALPGSLTGEIIYQFHPSDCAKYLKCQALTCPNNYYWNSRTKKCDFPHNAQCPFLEGSSNSKPLSTLLHNYLQMTPQLGEIFTLQYPNDCGKFYECQIMMCPINHHWNSRLQQCDLSQATQCFAQPNKTEILDTSTVVVPTAFTAPPTPTDTTPVSGNGWTECLDCAQTCDGYLHHYMPHPYDCHKFIQCNGWSFIHTCPDNLFWNAKLSTCDRICVTN